MRFPNELTGRVGIIGARGRQGTSVGQALDQFRHENPSIPIQLRALSRQFTKDTTPQVLSWLREGDEVAYVNLDQSESLSSAFEGLDYLFVMTDYWETRDAERESTQLASVTEALTRLTTPIRGVVLSSLSLESCQDVSEEEIPASFRGKTSGRSQFLKHNIPLVTIYPPFFWEDIFTWFPLRGRDPDQPQQYTWPFPFEAGDAIPGMSLADLGEVVVKLLGRFSRYRGDQVRLCGEINLVEEMRWYLEGHLQKADPRLTIQLRPPPLTELATEDGNELGLIFGYYQKHFCPTATERRPIYHDAIKRIYPKAHCFYSWIKGRKEKFVS